MDYSKPLLDPNREAQAQIWANSGSRRQMLKALGRSPGDSTALQTTATEVIERAQWIVAQRFKRANVTADRVFEELSRVAFADAADLFDENGDLIPVHRLPEHVSSTITGIDVEVTKMTEGNHRKGPRGKANVNVPAEADKVARIVKIKRADKMVALGVLAKHFKIVNDVEDGVNAIASALADRLGRARRRVDVTDITDVEPRTPRAVTYDPATLEEVPVESGVSPLTGHKLRSTGHYEPGRVDEVLGRTPSTPDAAPATMQPAQPPQQGADDETLW